MTNPLTNIPSGYKPSPLGPIPEDWEVKRLGEVCTFHNGRAYSQKELLSSGKYRVLRVGNFFTNSSWYWSDMELEDDKYANTGDLLYAWSASFGPRFWEGEKVIYHYHIWKIDSFKNISKEFLYSFLLFDAAMLTNTLQGGTMVHVTKENMEKRNIAIPSIIEQNKIVDLLSLWDTAIAKQTALIEKLTLRKRGLMQQLLTGKKRLKGFSGEWKKCSYSSILKEIKRSLIWDEDELYKLISVRRRSEGLFFRESLYGREIATKNLRPAKAGDFLISKMQIVHGASGLVTEDFDNAKISGSYIALVAKDDNILDIEYFNLWSQTPRFYHQTFTSSFGVHIEKMTFDLDTFMSFGMPLPPIKEQHAIVSLMNSVNKEIEIQKQKLAAMQEQKKGLMQVLLSGKRRII